MNSSLLNCYLCYLRGVKSGNGQALTSENGPTTKIDPKLGTQRKTAGVRKLPKIDRYFLTFQMNYCFISKSVNSYFFTYFGIISKSLPKIVYRNRFQEI